MRVSLILQKKCASPTLELSLSLKIQKVPCVVTRINQPIIAESKLRFGLNKPFGIALIFQAKIRPLICHIFRKQKQYNKKRTTRNLAGVVVVVLVRLLTDLTQHDTQLPARSHLVVGGKLVVLQHLLFIHSTVFIGGNI